MFFGVFVFFVLCNQLCIYIWLYIYIFWIVCIVVQSGLQLRNDVVPIILGCTCLIIYPSYMTNMILSHHSHPLQILYFQKFEVWSNNNNNNKKTTHTHTHTHTLTFQHITVKTRIASKTGRCCQSSRRWRKMLQKVAGFPVAERWPQRSKVGSRWLIWKTRVFVFDWKNVKTYTIYRLNYLVCIQRNNFMLEYRLFQLMNHVSNGWFNHLVEIEFCVWCSFMYTLAGIEPFLWEIVTMFLLGRCLFLTRRCF